MTMGIMALLLSALVMGGPAPPQPLTSSQASLHAKMTLVPDARFALDGVAFTTPTGKALAPLSMLALRDLALVLQKHPELTIRVEAFLDADAAGASARAESVVARLAALGMPPGHALAKGLLGPPRVEVVVTAGGALAVVTPLLSTPEPTPVVVVEAIPTATVVEAIPTATATPAVEAPAIEVVVQRTATIQPQSTEPPLIDAATNDVFQFISETKPAAFVVEGPTRIQVDFRPNIPTGAKNAPALTLEIRRADKVRGDRRLAQFQIMPVESLDLWIAQAEFKPGISAGFYIDVGAGKQFYEFRLHGGGPAGGGILLTESKLARKTLSANAMVVTSFQGVSSWSGNAIPAMGFGGGTPPPVTESAFTMSAGLGGAWRSERYSYDRDRALDMVGAVRWKAAPYASVTLGSDWRNAGYFTRVLEPGGRAEFVREDRYALGVAGEWTGNVQRLGYAAGLGTRYVFLQDSEAPHQYALAGPVGRIDYRLDRVRFEAGAEGGLPLYDTTPRSLYLSGNVRSRVSWWASVDVGILGGPAKPRLVVAYRGEILQRSHSASHAEGFLITAQVEF